jgi:molecular chaperone DnaK
MVRDAEEHAAEDKKRREEADTRNQGEQMVYQIEKLIKDNDQKLSEEVKADVQADVDAVKAALAGEDFDAVKSSIEKLTESQTKLGEAIYAAASQEPEATDESTEDVVDAEVVDEEESK